MTQTTHSSRFSLGPTLALLVLLASVPILSGCAGVVLGGVATGAYAVAQERSVGDALDDAGIKLKVNDKVLGNLPHAHPGLETEVIEGRVLLAGFAPTPEDRDEIVRLTWTVTGVRQVINELQIGDSSSFADLAKDSWITTQLRTSLVTDFGITDINYNIETVNGTIYILGIAQNQSEIDMVTSHASTISGVERVISYAITKDDPSRFRTPPATTS